MATFQPMEYQQEWCRDTSVGSAHLPPFLLEHEHGVEPSWTTWTMFVTTDGGTWALGQPPPQSGKGEPRQVCGAESHTGPRAPTF